MAIDPQECLVHALGQFPGFVWTTDANAVITSAWGAGMAMLGLQPNETVGMTLGEYFGTDDPHFPVHEAHGRVMRGELAHLNQHWQGRDFESRLQPLFGEDGTVVGCFGITYDTTECKEAELRLREQVKSLQQSEQQFRVLEHELRESRRQLEERVAERTEALTAANRRLQEEERHLQEILDNTTAMVYVKDSEGRYELINAQFSRVFHMSAAEVVGKTDVDIFPVGTAARFRANDLQVQTECRAIQFDEVAPHDDGPHHYISVKFPLGGASGGPCSVCGISKDITDRKEAEERLRREEQLLRKLLELREREQMLLAYDILDGLVQDVVGAKMRLEARSSEHVDGAVLDATSYQQILGLLVEAIDEGRRLISELRPPILDEQGIIGSVEYLVAEHLQKSGCHIDFRHDVQFDRLSPLLEQAVFRIVQEALNNVARHSAAAEATVDLRQIERELHLEVRDRGSGFDPHGVSPDRFGLRGIVERARLFGGRATVESHPGGGTRIFVRVPMDQPVQ